MSVHANDTVIPLTNCTNYIWLLVAELGEATVAPVWEAVADAWVEIFLVAVAVHVYFLLSNGPLLTTTKRDAKKAELLRQAFNRKPRLPPHLSAVPETAAVGHGFRSASRKNINEDPYEEGRLVSAFLRKVHTCRLTMLVEYDDLVLKRQVDLHRYILDLHSARSLYSSLIRVSIMRASKDTFTGDPSTPTLCRAASQNLRHFTARLLADMRMFGFPRDAEFYCTAVKHLIANKLLADALWLYGIMANDGFAPDRQTLISLANAASSCGRKEQAVALFKDVCSTGQPPMKVYMCVLRLFDKDWRGAVELLTKAKALGAMPDNLILNTVLTLCIEAQQAWAAELVLDDWRELVDVISCNILMKGYAQQGELRTAEKLLENMLANGPSPNIITFNTLMDCAVRTLQALRAGERIDRGGFNEATEESKGRDLHAAIARRPWELLQQLTDLCLEPDRYTCSTLVKGLHLSSCSPEDIDRTIALLRSIGRERLHQPGVDRYAGPDRNQGARGNARLSEVLFNTLLDACAAVHDLDRMAEIFAMMQEFDVTVSAVTYGTLIKAFGHEGKLQHCHEVWAQMKQMGVAPTVVTFGCYIESCLRNQDFDEAERIFNSMQALNVDPNCVVYTSMIRGFAHAKRPVKALELYSRMRASGIEATGVAFNAVIEVLEQNLADQSTLKEAVESMCLQSRVPDAVMGSILVKASCNMGDLDNALLLFSQVKGRGFALDQVAFNALLLACSKAGRVAHAEEVFEEMCKSGMKPTHVTTSIMVKMYGKMKMLEKAIEINELVEQKYSTEPNLFVYTCLVQACVQNQHVRRGWDIFASMLKSGKKPDSIMYGTMIHGCVYLSRFEHAMCLVRHAYLRPLVHAQESPDAPQQPLLSEVLTTLSACRPSKPVALQMEVVKVLSSALRRKQRLQLLSELEEIVGNAAEQHREEKTRAERTKASRARPGARQAFAA